MTEKGVSASWRRPHPSTRTRPTNSPPPRTTKTSAATAHFGSVEVFFLTATLPFGALPLIAFCWNSALRRR